ncbi:MAG TPA: tRNA lysidine(34) synthetase TilS [Candidatus Krumholzibacteria bacterium]|nr:tRNA lysidine(34) synthetase TilS [Candidatus Krumholzibacteria bacterium]
MNHVDRDNPVARALRGAFPRRSVIVAAVSGGGDSMAMLHALCHLAPELDLTVIAAHFDHQLRKHSHLDAELVARMAYRWGARIAPGRGDVREHRTRRGTSIEAMGREMRYAFLERVADETGASAIATAHTRDDQVETILMRIDRGAGARGCRGILFRRGRVVRPLLGVTRRELRDYCREHGVPYVDDPSNDYLEYLRNGIRHRVLPDLRLWYPGIDQALLRIAENADAEFRRAEAATSRRLQVYLQPESERTWVLGLEAFHGLDDSADRLHLINAAFETMSARDDITAEHHEAVLALIDAVPGTIASLYRMHVRREHDGLVFARNSDVPERELSMHVLTAPGQLDLDGWHIDAERIEAPGPDQLSNTRRGVAYVACDDTMVVRYPREGDRIQPFGMEGHKKLSDVFIDRKIPKRMRAATPVVEVDGEIVWVVGVTTSERCRISQETHTVVKLTATRREP